MNAYKELETIFEKLSHVQHAQVFLHWDEAVMMPTGGGKARGHALSTLSSVHHETLTQARVAELIQAAKQQDNLNNWQQANLLWMDKKYRNSICLPVELVKEMTLATTHSQQAWRQMRADNNWKDFAPILEKTFKLTFESAKIRSDLFGLSPYDILIDEYSPGITQDIIDPIFSRLKKELPPLIERIIEKQSHENTIQPKGPFDIDQQKHIGENLMKAIGFNFDCGRLDTSHHPFCTGIPEDVRITTRYREDEFTSALMGICHETGHALYEQNRPVNWREQPVGAALGMSVHESQSLLIEMQACRSVEFMTFLCNQLKEHFGSQEAFTPSNLYKLYTRVCRGFIRVDADEITYPLHIILRYEIERALFNGELTVADLPEYWDSKMKTYFNLSTKGNYQDGIMQDVHWPSGAFGYFPAYTIGRLMASQFYSAARQENPNIQNHFKEGNFTTLRDWLHKNIHQYASFLDYGHLLKNATGESLNADYFIEHIQQRY